MKTISVGDAQGQLGRLIAEACSGEFIVLADGDKRVALEPQVPLDLNEDSPELEAALLSAANGPFTAYAPEEMREACERVIGIQAWRLMHGARDLPHRLVEPSGN